MWFNGRTELVLSMFVNVSPESPEGFVVGVGVGVGGVGVGVGVAVIACSSMCVNVSPKSTEGFVPCCATALASRA